jgi:hypothetical protein
VRDFTASFQPSVTAETGAGPSSTTAADAVGPTTSPETLETE